VTDALIPPEGATESRMSIGDHTLVVQRTDSGAVIRLLGSEGARPIEIEITPSGPVLRLRTGVSIVVDRALSLGAETVTISARRELSLRSQDKVLLSAGGEMASDAAAQTIVASDRDVKIRANDDVVLNGERIRLNG
jgi:hypothetical protein